MSLQPGQILNNRYQIIALLGQGGMGAVYRAYDQTMSRFVAIKERTPDPAALPQALAQARAQFKSEAQILGSLAHPNLPHTYDYFTFGANEYVAMELIEGQSLESVVEKFGAIEEWRVRAWANQVLDALVYIHSRNVIHRDIKPANILLKPDGNVVLVDFGLVKLFDPRNPQTQTVMRGMGTPGYAPLEQFSPGMQTDARSDIYSFGATLYHLLSGRAPVDVPQRMGNPNLLVSLRAINPNISPQMEGGVAKALEIHPQNRFQNAAEMKQAITPAAPVYATQRQAPISAPIPGTYAPPIAVPTRRGTSIWSWLIILLIVGIGGGLGLVAVNTFIRPAPTPPPATIAAPAVVPTAQPLITGKSEQRGKDNAEMVLVPAGNFIMGSTEGFDNEKPVRTVYLDAFWIDRYEVTNALYKKCVDAGVCPPPGSKGSAKRSLYYDTVQYGRYPVIYVAWGDAKAYCEWSGKRLPTEAEWEKAARGTDARAFPWGNTFDKNVVNSSEVGPGETLAVGSFPAGASPYGAMDMAGNVWEWVQDWLDPDYYQKAPTQNPKGPTTGTYKGLRGGSWGYSMFYMRAAHRGGDNPYSRFDYIGFRCAQDATAAPTSLSSSPTPIPPTPTPVPARRLDPVLGEDFYPELAFGSLMKPTMPTPMPAFTRSIKVAVDVYWSTRF